MQISYSTHDFSEIEQVLWLATIIVMSFIMGMGSLVGFVGLFIALFLPVRFG